MPAARPSPVIPHVALYGDEALPADVDLVHFERIPVRSSRHDWEIEPHVHDAMLQVLLIESGSGGEAFRQVVTEYWVPALERFRPRLVLISAGFDAHAADDMAQLRLGAADYGWVTDVACAIANRHAEGRIVSTRTYAKLAKAGYTGIKEGNKSAQVAIGETSSHGRDKPKTGQTDTVAPATFMKGVAAAGKPLKLKFDAWAHHPYPFPVAQKPTQKVRYPNVTLTTMSRFEQDLDKAFGRKQIPVWITEYGNETKPGEPAGVTESQQARYMPQAIALARKDPRVPMFIWFVMQDSNGSLWQSGIYRLDGLAKRAEPRFAPAAGPLDMVNGKMTVKGGTKNPQVTVYLREYCANNTTGTTVGYTVRGYLGTKLMSVDQGATPLARDSTSCSGATSRREGRSERACVRRGAGGRLRGPRLGRDPLRQARRHPRRLGDLLLGGRLVLHPGAARGRGRRRRLRLHGSLQYRSGRVACSGLAVGVAYRPSGSHRRSSTTARGSRLLLHRHGRERR